MFLVPPPIKLQFPEAVFKVPPPILEKLPLDLLDPLTGCIPDVIELASKYS